MIPAPTDRLKALPAPAHTTGDPITPPAIAPTPTHAPTHTTRHPITPPTVGRLSGRRDRGAS
jgi:hypothetical protein